MISKTNKTTTKAKALRIPSLIYNTSYWVLGVAKLPSLFLRYVRRKSWIGQTHQLIKNSIFIYLNSNLCRMVYLHKKSARRITPITLGARQRFKVLSLPKNVEETIRLFLRKWIIVVQCLEWQLSWRTSVSVPVNPFVIIASMKHIRWFKTGSE